MLGGADVAPPPEFREYVLAHEFHMPPTVQDEQPAVRLDWLIACHNTVERVRAEKQASHG